LGPWSRWRIKEAWDLGAKEENWKIGNWKCNSDFTEVGIRGEIWRNPTCRIQAIENPMRLNDQKREKKKER